ncbi:MAG: ABC transporter ATP-binding protein [Phycisphaerae bacterium]
MSSNTNGRETMLRIAGVRKSYGQKVALKNLDLELYAGEVFAFLGHNGAGKTTTLKLTVGLLQPDAGSISVCGYSMRNDAIAGKSHVAYVPDQPHLYDKLTGREFLEFTLEMYRIPATVGRSRLAMWSERLEMNSFLDQLNETYSHGMKQRVALAAALIHEPDLLVVDEPLVGLDPRTIRVARNIFREFADSGRTVFMSTHTLDIAEQVADRIGIIQEGVLTALGTLTELRDAAAHNGRLEDVFMRLTGGAISPEAEVA